LKVLANICNEAIGLLVDDWIYAATIVAWILLMVLVTKAFRWDAVGGIFVLGSCLILIWFSFQKIRNIKN